MEKRGRLEAFHALHLHRDPLTEDPEETTSGPDDVVGLQRPRMLRTVGRDGAIVGRGAVGLLGRGGYVPPGGGGRCRRSCSAVDAQTGRGRWNNASANRFSVNTPDGTACRPPGDRGGGVHRRRELPEVDGDEPPIVERNTSTPLARGG